MRREGMNQRKRSVKDFIIFPPLSLLCPVVLIVSPFYPALTSMHRSCGLQPLPQRFFRVNTKQIKCKKLEYFCSLTLRRPSCSPFTPSLWSNEIEAQYPFYDLPGVHGSDPGHPRAKSDPQRSSARSLFPLLLPLSSLPLPHSHACSLNARYSSPLLAARPGRSLSTARPPARAAADRQLDDRHQ